MVKNKENWIFYWIPIWLFTVIIDMCYKFDPSFCNYLLIGLLTIILDILMKIHKETK